MNDSSSERKYIEKGLFRESCSKTMKQYAAYSSLGFILLGLSFVSTNDIGGSSLFLDF